MPCVVGFVLWHGLWCREDGHWGESGGEEGEYG